MIEFDKSRINGIKCVGVSIDWHFHGPTHTPRVSAEIVYLSDGKPLGTVTIDNVSEEIPELAKGLVDSIEKEFAKHIQASGVDKELARKPENIKGLVKEF